MVASPQAAFICIGNEILSGKTRDCNLQVLAQWLNEKGIRLAEARVIADSTSEIVATVRELSKRYDYVFTSGGIGPTHDDITSDAIARAFEVPLELNPEALDALVQYYQDDRELTEPRKKMACVPQGCSLIKNRISGAAGFLIDNVYVLAGVPSIFKVMLEDMEDTIVGGDIWHSSSLEVYCGESRIAETLSTIQDRYPQVEIGSYPKYNPTKKYYTELVFRSQYADQNKQAVHEIMDSLQKQKIDFMQ